MCNISGFCGSGPPNPLRLKLLVAMGTERGEDSIGIVANNEVHKVIRTYAYGVNSIGYNKAEGIHFIKEYNYPEFVKTNTVLQHNRKKSHGVVSLNAAHPYEISYVSETKGEHKFYLVHNGTLTNIDELAEKYDVDPKDFETDSHMLAHLICIYGFEPLTYYDGGAALAFYWDENPDELFLYKGSKEVNKYDFNSQKNITYMEEERPLHYIYLDQGIYFSSLMDQLEAISLEEKPKTFTVKHNCVYKFKNGKLEFNTQIERNPIPKKITKVITTTNAHYGSYYNANTSEEEAPKNLYKTNRAMICWHEGKYQLIKKKKPTGNADGVYTLNSHGVILGKNINDPDSEIYYFIDGDMIKDAETYYDCINNKALVWASKTHPYACHVTAADRYQTGQYLIVDKLYKPKLCHYYLRISNTSYYVESIERKDALLHIKMNADLLEIEAFNQVHGTNFTTKKDCSNYYFKKFPDKKVLDWKEFNPRRIIGDLGANNCFYPKENKQESDSKKENTIKALDFNNNKKNLFTDDDLDKFNQVYGTNFITRKEANQWHYDTYNRPYDDNWPDPKMEEFDDLPFNVNSDKSLEFVAYEEEIQKQMEDEYSILLYGIEEFLDEYNIYSKNFSEKGQKKLEKLNKIKKFL